MKLNVPRPQFYVLNSEMVPVPTINIVDWFMWIDAHRKLFSTQIGKVLISTAFLGCDCSYGDGPPMLFETMVFWEDEGDGEKMRYETFEQALEGHRDFIARYALIQRLPKPLLRLVNNRWLELLN